MTDELKRQQARQVFQFLMGNYAKEYGLGANRWQDLVAMFHLMNGQVHNTTPSAIDDETLDLRIELIREEFKEFTDASVIYKDRDNVGYEETRKAFIEMIDALGDMIIVVLGTAVSMGVNMDPVIQEQMLANFSKAGDDGKPILRADGKVLKGPNYFKPNLAQFIPE